MLKLGKMVLNFIEAKTLTMSDAAIKIGINIPWDLKVIIMQNLIYER